MRILNQIGLHNRLDYRLCSLKKFDRSMILLVVFALGWIPALIGRNVVHSTSELYHLAYGAHPYFIFEHAVQLYLLTPLVVISACLLLLSPGLFLSLALNSAESMGQWLFTALALSLFAVSIVAGSVQSMMEIPFREGNFLLLMVVTSLSCFFFWIVQIGRGRRLAWPFDQPHSGNVVFSVLVVITLVLIVLTPYNPIDLNSNQPLYVWGRSHEIRRKILAAYPDRPVRIVNGPSMTREGFQ